MKIKKLFLQNFRNYGQEEFVFDDGLNVLFGKNGQGKTNCAEAVFYLCTGASLRIKHEKQLIKMGETQAKIIAEAENRYGNVTIEATILEEGREIKVNGTKIAKNADLMGLINSVFFSPGELRLIQDGPDERRRFMNMSISQTSPAYYTALLRYNKILDQRNALLKNHDVSLVLDTLPVWDDQLCRYAATIIKKRAEFLKMLSPIAAEYYAYLTDGVEDLEIKPDKAWEGTEEEIAESLKRKLSYNYEKDLRLGYTTVGPHRDDIDFYILGMDAKSYASQGQTRTAALSVKLAEVEIFKNISGEYPVLILDDVMSELDLPRRKKLLSKVKEMQTILTCTHAERVLYGADCKKIRIEKGKNKRRRQMKADLHVHSVYSDGRYTPEEICNRAFEYGVELISITDHDTMLCQVNKRAAAKKYGLKYVAGWEISAHHDDRKLHILGYNCKGNSVYDDFIKLNSKNAILRMEDRLAKLKKEGIIVTMDEVFAYREKGTPIHTMHLSYVLAKKLKTTSDAAYNAYLRKGAPAYSPLGRPTPYEALECIKGCGGFAVIAHPGRVEMPVAELRRLIEGLASQGLAGIETVYTTHTKEQTEYFTEMAKSMHLLQTGGSDTHFEDETHGIGKPYFTPSAALLERLEIL